MPGLNRLLLVLAGDILCYFFSFLWVTCLRRWEYLGWKLFVEHLILFGWLLPLWIGVFYLSGLYETRYQIRSGRASIASAVFLNLVFSALILYLVSGFFRIPVPKTILFLGSVLTWAMMEYWRTTAMSLFVSNIKTPQAIVLDRRALIEASQNGHHKRLEEALWRGVPIFTQSGFEAFKMGKIPPQEITDEWIVERLLGPLPDRLFYRVFKRIFDLLLVFSLLPLALVFGVLVAFWIKIFLGGPVIYSQLRIGHEKKPFKLRKFRTMPRAFPDERHGASPHLTDSSSLLTHENDPRVPKSVRWIRRFHLDEIPQIINIVKGEMSWVGPRPEQVPITKELESKIPFYWTRHIATPGLTGWAQVNMGYAHTLEEARERFSYDLYYLINQNTVLDLSILARTFRNFLAADGR